MATVERPAAAQSTHEVANQPPPLRDYNPFDADPALREALERDGGAWGAERVRKFAQIIGSGEAQDHSKRAQRNIPQLKTHDRYGNRIDEVEYDPSWHWMLALGIENGLSSFPWREPQPGAHVVRAAMFHLMNGLDTGPCCPVGVNYAAVPSLRQAPALAAEWEPRVTGTDYRTYAQLGMAMTEKQGGSDLRANTTRAEKQTVSEANGVSRAEPGEGNYAITGHKWFCSIVMCDAFFTLAQAPGGLSCFLMERGPGFHVQRLKDKLGGRSLASSEVEFDGVRAWLIGEEGRGVATIATQVNYTRLDTAIGTAGMLRRAVAEAVHYTRHRSAFGKLLADQPLMRNVLADLQLESEAMTATSLRLARSYEDDSELGFRRFATAVEKYWIAKRGALAAVEALECLGGNGFVEESMLPQLYRDIEISTVWEGSGNVAALDVLRAAAKEPEGLPAFLAECELAAGADARLDAHLEGVKGKLAGLEHMDPQWEARRVVEDLAVALQASLLVRHAPPAVADAFCASRLGERGRAFGTLPRGLDTQAIVERALTI